MSLTRIHNLSISLDGFATGEPQSADAPFGHAGERLHEWMFGTRFWDAGGTAGVDNAFAERHTRTELVDTRSHHAIRAVGMSCSNSSAACIRTASRRARPRAVRPPPSAYLMIPE